MKIENNTIFFGNSSKYQEEDHVIKSKQNKKSSGALFAGDANLQQDEVALKKSRAQKQAMKVLQDQFNNDKKIDDGIQERNQHQVDLSSEAENAQKELNKLNNKCDELKAKYEVKDDSEEQKNLELLVKKSKPGTILSDEERKQLETMGPVTEYQQAVLDNEKIKQSWQENIDDAIDEIWIEGKTIDAIKLAKLAKHPMVDAQKAADGILEKASEEAIGTLMDQVKDKIDKDMDDTKDKIEKAKEEKEEEEKIKEEIEEKQKNEEEQERIENNKQNDADMSKITQSDSDQEKLQMELKEIIVNEKVIYEDIKGIVVDETI